MSFSETPVKQVNKLSKHIEIPPSPFMQKLGYGTGVLVYKLERSPLSNKVQSPWALKKASQIHPKYQTFGARLKAEAEVLARLDHPNIVGFRALILSKDQPCLAMENCSKSLGDLIEERFDDGLEAFPANNIMKVATDISNALNYLHNTALILHCDIKSYNILIKDDFAICKLCDFGTSLPLTSSGVLDEKKAGKDAKYIGTFSWMAPELLNEPEVITSKADIYSFGLVLWEMLSLTHPNIETSPNSTLEQTIESELEFDELLKRERPALPSQDFDSSYFRVLEIFYCCTESDRELRPSASDLVKSLTETTKG